MILRGKVVLLNCFQAAICPLFFPISNLNPQPPPQKKTQKKEEWKAPFAFQSLDSLKSVVIQLSAYSLAQRSSERKHRLAFNASKRSADHFCAAIKLYWILVPCYPSHPSLSLMCEPIHPFVGNRKKIWRKNIWSKKIPFFATAAVWTSNMNPANWVYKGFKEKAVDAEPYSFTCFKMWQVLSAKLVRAEGHRGMCGS